METPEGFESMNDGATSAATGASRPRRPKQRPARAARSGDAALVGALDRLKSGIENLEQHCEREPEGLAPLPVDIEAAHEVWERRTDDLCDGIAAAQAALSGRPAEGLAGVAAKAEAFLALVGKEDPETLLGGRLSVGMAKDILRLVDVRAGT
jgi:hypothetical protein